MLPFSLSFLHDLQRKQLIINDLYARRFEPLIKERSQPRCRVVANPAKTV